jgi:pseudaminic acid biosynthesis-associated methylase
MPARRDGNGAEAIRLERLWAGRFGDAYVERNAEAGAGRHRFWRSLLERYPVASAIEVGCNVGANLQWVAQHLDAAAVYGVDVNETALVRLRQRLPGINAISSPARDLPFRDRWFDLAFTCGVLIHQPESTLPLVMSEIVRVSRRYVLAVEYRADETTEVPYRRQRGALFKRDYTRLYAELFPSLTLLDQGFLGRDEGWDDTTWCLFERA